MCALRSAHFFIAYWIVNCPNYRKRGGSRMVGLYHTFILTMTFGWLVYAALLLMDFIATWKKGKNGKDRH